MRPINRMLTIWVLISLCLLNGQAEADSLNTTIVVIIDSVKGRVIYKIDGQRAQENKLMDISDKLVALKGDDYPIKVLASEDVTIATIDILKRIFQKSGFKHFRFYIFDKDKRMMVEMILGADSAIPYSEAQ